MDKIIHLVYKTLLLLFLFSSLWEMKGQETYQMAYKLIGDDFYYEIYEGDIRTGPFELFLQLREDLFEASEGNTLSNVRIKDFHVDINRQIVYFLQNHGDLYKYNLVTGSIDHLLDITPENIDLFWNAKNEVEWLRVLDNNTFYIGGLTYAIVDLRTLDVQTIWQPPSLGQAFTEYYRTRSSLSVVKHHSDIIYSSNNRPGNNRLGIINKSDPDNPTILHEYSIDRIWRRPLISLRNLCDSAKIYILLDHINDQNIEPAWYEVDLEDGNFTYSFPALYFDNDRNEPNAIRHYPSQDWEQCLRRVDLDQDDSTLPELDYDQPQLCQFDNIPISDTDVDITSHRLLDSITLQIFGPTPDQWLSGVAVNTNIIGSGTHKLVITSLPTATTEDLQEAVNYVRYHQTASAGISSARVAVLGWLDGIHGDTAYAYIDLPPSLPDAGTDGLTAYCTRDSTIRLEPLHSGESGGAWYDHDYQRILPAQIDLATVDTFTTHYIIAYNGCADTSTHIVVVDPLPLLDDIADITLCPSDIYQVNLDELDDISVLWSDGSTQADRIISSAGDYAFTIRNQAGCTQDYSFALTYLPEPLVLDDQTSMCQGEQYPWRGRTISASGMYADTLRRANGCDSVIHRLDLQVTVPEPLAISFPNQLCATTQDSILILSDHHTITINGQTASDITIISQTGNYEISAIDPSGCSVSRTVIIDHASSPTITIEPSIDTVFHPDLELMPIYSSDVIEYLWTPSDFLNCEDCPFPTLLSDEEEVYQVLVTNDLGCTAEARINVSFRPPAIYLANVVSSGSPDLVNQVLFAQSDYELLYELEVYDRWGNKVFYGRDLPMNDPTIGWHVTPDVQTGVYVYVLKSGDEVISGDITVLH